MPGDHHISFDWKAFRFGTLVVVLFIGVAAGINQYSQALNRKEISTIAIAPIIPTSIKLQITDIDRTATTSRRIINTLSISDAIPNHGKFIAADLVAMQLTLYNNGSSAATYPIIDKGKPGTPWETPSGFYDINTKEKTHLSTIGKVYMPYSMEFMGNYFIHGIPYYPDGTLVSSAYSGGCIRLNTADAEKVYAFSDIGTKLFVYDGKREQPMALALSPQKIPSVTAESYIVADIDTGDVYLEHNASTTHPIASITKLMTALVANETINFKTSIKLSPSILFKTYDEIATTTASSTPTILFQNISIDPASVIPMSTTLPLTSMPEIAVSEGATSTSPLLEVATDTSATSTTPIVTDTDAPAVITSSSSTTTTPTKKIKKTVKVLHIGRPELFLVGDLLDAMLLRSNNEIADVLAHTYGFNGFISWMNDMARSLDMQSSVFSDASGLSGDNVSNVDDLFRLIRYIDHKKSFILAITHTPLKAVPSQNGQLYSLFNVNHPADTDPFAGGKVGQTTLAKETMAIVLTVPVGDTVRHVAIVVLHSTNQKKDVLDLASWILSASSDPAQIRNTACVSCLPHTYRNIPE